MKDADDTPTNPPNWDGSTRPIEPTTIEGLQRKVLKLEADVAELKAKLLSVERKTDTCIADVREATRIMRAATDKLDEAMSKLEVSLEKSMNQLVGENAKPSDG
jgi:predicted RNase H-like nuclease (RuvC/YqgF family)